jgi:hypothetical protein
MSYNVSVTNLKDKKKLFKTTRGSISNYQTEQAPKFGKGMVSESQLTSRGPKKVKNFLKTPRHTISTHQKEKGLSTVKHSMAKKVAIPTKVSQPSYREISAKKYSMQHN